MPSRTFNYCITRENGRLRMESAGAATEYFSSKGQLINYFLNHTYRQLRESMSAYVALHAGSAIYGGRRFLFTGPKRAGKTTLAVHSLYGGIEVECDETVLLKAGHTIAIPRRFHIKASSRDILPAGLVLGKLPTTKNGDGETLFSLDPTTCGRDWRVSSGRVGAIFFMQRTAGATAAVEPCPRTTAVYKLMEQTYRYWTDQGDAYWLQELCKLVNTAQCFQLSVGSPQATIALIKREMECLS